MQQLQPSLREVIHASKRLSTADQLFLAKTLLDNLLSVESLRATKEQLLEVEEQATAEDEALANERDAFVALHPTLLAQYPGEYVAVHHGKLIDHDKDGLALSLRIRERFPDEFVWIAPLKEQPLEEWVVRSPRFESIAQ